MVYSKHLLAKYMTNLLKLFKLLYHLWTQSLSSMQGNSKLKTRILLKNPCIILNILMIQLYDLDLVKLWTVPLKGYYISRTESEAALQSSSRTSLVRQSCVLTTVNPASQAKAEQMHSQLFKKHSFCEKCEMGLINIIIFGRCLVLRNFLVLLIWFTQSLLFKCHLMLSLFCHLMFMVY